VLEYWSIGKIWDKSILCYSQHSSTPNPLSDFRIPTSDFFLALSLMGIQDIPKAVTQQIKAHDDD